MRLNRSSLSLALLGGLFPGNSFGAAPNQPPTACFSVIPTNGTVDTAFKTDADCSTDDRTAPSRLRVRWDWENDGTWDTPYSTTKSATHQYANEGIKTIKLEVRDSAGLTGTTTQGVLVLPTLRQALVGEPPSTPGATEPDVDLDPEDPRKLVASAITGSLGEGVPVPFPAFYSTDGGQNWARSTGSLSSHALDTAVEFDGSGRAIFSAIDLGRRDGTPAGIVVGISTDGGQTFAAMSHAMDTSTAFAFPDGSTRTLCARQSSFFDFPKLAADRSAVSPYRNNLYLIAQALSFDLDGDGSCETSPHVFIRSRDGGATWESGQVIPGMRQPTGSIGIGPDGVIYISDPTVNTPFCSTGSGIALRKSLDGGASFLPATCALLSDTAFQPGLTWTAADASDPGKLYIAFSATVGALGPSDHIYVIRSVDAGATWAPPVRVDDLLADDRVDHLRPSLAASGNGRVDVAWMDYRNSTPKQWTRDRQPGDVYYSYSLDAGRTWAPNLRLSSSTSPLLSGAGNDYLTVVSSANTAHAIYAQDQTGNVLYEARLTTLIFH